MKEPYTQVPNRLIRSRLIDVYDKVVFMVIQSYNPSFPSYEQIAYDANMSRGRVWKALRNLEERGVIKRYKKGRRMVYKTFTNSLPDELVGEETVYEVNSTSLPGELHQSTG